MEIPWNRGGYYSWRFRKYSILKKEFKKKKVLNNWDFLEIGCSY